MGVCLNFAFPSNVAQIRQCLEMVDHLGGEYGQRLDYFFTFPDQRQSTAQLEGLPELDLCSKYIVCLDPYLEAVFKREQTKATSVERRLASSVAIYVVHDFFYRLWH